MEIVNLFLNLDSTLATAIAQLGNGIYVLLFTVVFMETGFVVTPFLPGDTLLFGAGSLAAVGQLNLPLAMAVMFVAAVAGDTVNYQLGHHTGRRAFKRKDSRFFKQQHLLKAQAFYETHGGKTIILARFLPFIRTFAPFVAGISRMHYPRFLMFNVVGAFLWIVSLSLAGYWFGNIPIIKNNFEVTIVGIILLSMLPGVYHFIAGRYRGRRG